MAEVERRLAELRRRAGGRRSATTPARPSPPAASGCARCSSCSAPGPGAGRGGDPRRGRDRARPHGDARPRRRPRRGAAAARACRPSSPASGRERAVATGDLLFSRAFAELAAGDAARRVAGRQVDCSPQASVALARGELAQRQRRLRPAVDDRALPAPLRAQDRGPVRVRLRDRRRAARGRGHGAARLRPRDRARLPAPRRRPRRRSARPSGPARPAAPTCSTAPSRCPFILARERDPALADLDLRALDAAGAEEVCDRIAATGAPEQVRAEARERVDGGEARPARRRRPAPRSWSCSSWSPTASSSGTRSGRSRRARR